MNTSYIDLKQGRCTPLQYFKTNYVRNGSVVEVATKRVKTKIKHSFYVIKNTLLDYSNNEYTEIKLYDIDRGLIYKERLRTPRNKVNSKGWFEHLLKYGLIGNYISFLNDKEQE